MLSYNIGKMNNSIAEVMSKSTLITAKYGQNRISISITHRGKLRQGKKLLRAQTEQEIEL